MYATARTSRYGGICFLFACSALLVACGGGSSGGDERGGGSLSLVSFQQASLDTVALNQVLTFEFSGPVDPESVSTASIQIRRGAAFGASTAGHFEVDGSTVRFWPQLPGVCDLSDAGLRAGTTYRVTIAGGTEAFAVRHVQGRNLNETTAWEFSTRDDSDPDRFIDVLPGSAPRVLESTPALGAAAAGTGSIADPQRITLTMSENLDPCTVGLDTVSIEIHEVGGSLAESVENPENGNLSGFVTGASDISDQLPANPTRWGSDTGTLWAGGPQALPASVHLVQDYASTQIVISPLASQSSVNPTLGGVFPDNVLIVVRVTSAVQDFGGSPLTPYTLSFTTENTDGLPGQYVMEVEGETPFSPDGTTADVNTPRSPSVVQGYLLFSGDGDNGADPYTPSLPETPSSGCNFPRQYNNGTKDDLDVTGNVTLHTGATENTCPNATDGSTGVVWEFRKFTIRSGGTVHILGVNPAIILVQQDALIEAGGRLIVRGDGQSGSPRGDGRNGYIWTSYSTTITLGGEAVAGGGDGGDAAQFEAADHGGDGYSAYGSDDGRGVEGGHGAGLGGTNHDTTYPNSPGTSQGGGGGGHALEGGTSTNILGTAHTNQTVTRGDGGDPYPDTANAQAMRGPSAGAGGGAGGNEEWDQSYDGIYSTGGGSGGAGGGFIDITSSGTIRILGTIDASGGDGGGGGTTAYYAGPGGGGGGAGGGIRLLTPNQIILGAAAVITTAGGSGGNSPLGSSGTGGPQNHGAPGSYGRIAMEDGDSVITGLQGAIVIPGEGDDGFHRGVFDANRFRGGGTTTQALTELVWVGPLRPIYEDPVQADFVAGAPLGNTPGPGSVVIEIEAQGYGVRSDGTPNLGSPTGYQVVGRFTDSGTASEPTWTPVAGLSGLSGNEFLQLRFTFHVSPTAGPVDPGPYLDRWVIRYRSDN